MLYEEFLPRGCCALAYLRAKEEQKQGKQDTASTHPTKLRYRRIVQHDASQDCCTSSAQIER